MNIGYLQELLTQIEDIKVIDKFKEIDGVIYHIMGLIKKKSTVQILILHYDKDSTNSLEEFESIEVEDTDKIPKSNRTRLNRLKKEDINLILNARKLIANEEEYNITQGESTPCTMQDSYYTLLITRFLLSGWKAVGIDNWNINLMHLTTLTLAGEYNSLPNISYKSKLQFIVGPMSTSHLVEEPIKLHVGNDYSEKLYFKDKLTGEEHWVQINQVYLYDMWAGMLTLFDSKELQNQMPANELMLQKETMKLNLRKICPEGMYFPMIEYECEDNTHLQFYTKAWLDHTLEVSNNSSMGFIIGPDRPKGILGLKLKCAIIQEPMAVHTAIIETELYEYQKLIEEIIIIE